MTTMKPRIRPRNRINFSSEWFECVGWHPKRGEVVCGMGRTWHAAYESWLSHDIPF